MKQGNNDRKVDRKRRELLRNGAVAGAGTMAMALLPEGVAAREPGEEERPREKKGYRLTEHVLAYYESAAS